MSRAVEEKRMNIERLNNEMIEVKQKFITESNKILEDTGTTLIPVIRFVGEPIVNLQLKVIPKPTLLERWKIKKIKPDPKLIEANNRLNMLQEKLKVNLCAIITQDGAKVDLRWNRAKILEEQNNIITPPAPKIVIP